jgi:hypothetical protein
MNIVITRFYGTSQIDMVQNLQTGDMISYYPDGMIERCVTDGATYHFLPEGKLVRIDSRDYSVTTTKTGWVLSSAAPTAEIQAIVILITQLQTITSYHGVANPELLAIK